VDVDARPGAGARRAGLEALRVEERLPIAQAVLYLLLEAGCMATLTGVSRRSG
jgi:glutamine synthetase